MTIFIIKLNVDLLLQVQKYKWINIYYNKADTLNHDSNVLI